MSEDLDDLVERIMDAESGFRRACSQIMIMNRTISEMQSRYEITMKQQARMFRYTLRVRIAVAEGVRNMFYEYARQKADLIVDLRNQIEHIQNQVEEADDDECVEYGEEYDLSDSELEFSDIDLSDFDDEDIETDSFCMAEIATAPDIANDERKTEKIKLEYTDLNETEISVDSAFLDDSVMDDDFQQT
ncbi:hypothetical protein ACF0H5_006360 [Mactra antiquata]